MGEGGFVDLGLRLRLTGVALFIGGGADFVFEEREG